jgi:cobalamin transport system ATP-binding protein
MTQNILEVQGLGFAVNDKSILDDITFNVQKGEYVSIVGPNGAGKSTLLKCLNKINKKISGDIILDGNQLSFYSQKQIARKVSYVPQSDGRQTPFTVYEFIKMGRYPYLSPFSSITKKDKKIISEAMEITGTLEFSNRQMGTLSGGEKQKVFISAAIAQKADIIMLDEPTTFLDPKHQVDIFATLRTLNKTHKTTVLSVTHDINSALQTSDKVIALQSGKIVFDGPSKELTEKSTLENIYGTPFQIVPNPESGKPFIVASGVE